jgi:hypothetical protein
MEVTAILERIDQVASVSWRRSGPRVVASTPAAHGCRVRRCRSPGAEGLEAEIRGPPRGRLRTH